MRKLLLIAGYAGSVAPFRGSLIAALQGAGVEVHVAAPISGVDLSVRGSLESLGVPVHDIPLQRTSVNPVADLVLLFVLYRLLRRIAPDMVLGYTIKPVIFGSIAAWLARIERRFALVTGLGFTFTAGRRGILPLLVRILYGFALGRTHLTFFQNPDDLEFSRALRIVRGTPQTFVVNGSGVDTEYYEHHPVRSDPPIFLMICRLLGDKGVREYVAAARVVKARFPGARFKLVGWIDGNPDAISQFELSEWVAEGAIEFLGKLADVRLTIAASTAYVLPSYREGTPRTVLEAMAMGRPIITTDAPGCRETVVDGDNGFLVPVQSVDALVEAMLKFIEDPTLASRMGKRSRQIAEEKYDVHKVNAVMLREMGIPAVSGTHAGAV